MTINIRKISLFAAVLTLLFGLSLSAETLDKREPEKDGKIQPEIKIQSEEENLPEKKMQTEDAADEEEKEQNWQIHGYLESENYIMYGKYRNEDKNEYLYTKVEEHVNLDVRYGDDNLYVRGIVHGYYYPADDDQSGESEPERLTNRVMSNELYLRSLYTYFDLCIGKQVIRWGTADAVNPTSYFSPIDLSEILLKDDDEFYLGANALSGTFMYGDFALQLVFVPVASVGYLPSANSPWLLRYPNEEVTLVTPFGSMDLSLPVEFQEQDSELNPEAGNSSYGGRFTGTLGTMDFSISGYHGIDQSVLFFPEVVTERQVVGIGPTGPVEADVPTKIVVKPQYKRVTTFGADFVYSIGDFNIQAEGAYSFNKKAVTVADIANSKPSVIEETKYVYYAAGINWLIDGDDFNIVLEFLQGIYPEDSDRYMDPLFSDLIAGSITKKFFNGSLSFEINGMYNVVDKDWILMPLIGYDFKNGFSIEVKGAIFEGEEGTLFGSYNSRDIVCARAKYKF